MKKRFFAIILALTLCAGLVTPAFAEDTESVTVAGITFDTIATDQHESYRDFLEEYVAEGYSWAPAQLAAAGPEVDLLYNLGFIHGFMLIYRKIVPLDCDFVAFLHVEIQRNIIINEIRPNVADTILRTVVD